MKKLCENVKVFLTSEEFTIILTDFLIVEVIVSVLISMETNSFLYALYFVFGFVFGASENNFLKKLFRHFHK